MQIAGIIAEYNPLHGGHTYQIEQTRRALGADTAIVCVMSGSFVQRGDFALVRKHARAEAAVKSGADLVVELPLPWAVSSAERFADGGVQILNATGLVTHLSFGSECGDAAALRAVAECLCSGAYRTRLRALLQGGASYAACRQRAAEELLGRELGALLAAPNNNLGVEYCKALLRQGSGVVPLAIRREGAAHDSDGAVLGRPSATYLRTLLRSGARDEALALMAPAMADIYRREETAGRTPVFSDTCQRAMLARLRTMTAAEFLAVDEGGEGLGNRFYAAARTACSVEELLQAVKTKRYAHARLRRMALWAYLGLTASPRPDTVPYLRVLSANAAGCALLGRMRKTARVPVLTKPADVRLLPERARELFAMEARATDLYTLGYPELAAAVGGSEWKEGPVIL